MPGENGSPGRFRPDLFVSGGMLDPAMRRSGHAMVVVVVVIGGIVGTLMMRLDLRDIAVMVRRPVIQPTHARQRDSAFQRLNRETDANS